MSNVLVILSGGMDSTTAMYMAQAQGHNVRAIGFNYNQRHQKELVIAELHCSHLTIPFEVLQMPDWAHGGSALTSGGDVPEGHYAQETMKQTVVPNRNSIMLNVAAGYGMAHDVEEVWTGVHAGDHPVYPDCRPEFIDQVNELLQVACDGFSPPVVVAPFMHKDKADIAEIGEGLGVDWELTWSCYKGGDIHCGRCSTCVERLEAFHLADVDDPTQYDDPDYWRTVTMEV